MVSGIRDNPPFETTLVNVYMWKRFPYRPSQSWPCMIIHNPQSFDHTWHSLHRELSLLGEFIWRKGVSPAMIILPVEVRQLVHPICLTLARLLARSPRQLGAIHIKWLFNFTTIQGKVNSPRVTRGRVVSGTRDHINEALEVKRITWHAHRTGP